MRGLPYVSRYTIYAQKEHAAGTLHETYKEAQDDQHDHE
jgi:hypothetical protein